MGKEIGNTYIGFVDGPDLGKKSTSFFLVLCCAADYVTFIFCNKLKLYYWKCSVTVNYDAFFLHNLCYATEDICISFLNFNSDLLIKKKL